MDGLIKLYHKLCDGHVGYILDADLPKSDFSNFRFLNMKATGNCCFQKLGCIKCGKYIKSPRELTIHLF